MSRYTFLNNWKKSGKVYEVAYGFDRPLQEYFIQVFDTTATLDPDSDDDVNCILWEGNRMSNKSNSDMLELFDEWGVPENHKQLLCLDLPF